MKIAAIYSRKSKFTGKGESIENQIQLCKQYATRFNVSSYLVYEDEGFSGKNANRPQFQKMLKDAKEKKFDMLICYRLDRVSRNIADFSVLINELEKLEIHFISINEQFDTSTPMGRAMMYIASVFAQLERETIAERVRDNMLELAKSGRWLGGQTPMGYKSECLIYLDAEFKERKMYKLAPISHELDVVKIIYEKYLEYQSISQVHKFLFSNAIKTKLGAEWNKNKVQSILRSPLYVQATDEVLSYLSRLGINVVGKADEKHGILTYNKSKGSKIKRNMDEWIAAVSKHEGILSAKKWLEVQYLLNKNKEKAPHLGKSSISLLTGILKCGICNQNMIVKHGHTNKKTGETYHYYVCSTKDASFGRRCTNKNIKVKKLDEIALNILRSFVLNKDKLIESLKEFEIEGQSPSINSIDQIKKYIEMKKNQIYTLTTQLSINAPLSNYFIPQIQKIDNEIKILEIALQKNTIENAKCLFADLNIGLYIKCIDDFKQLIELLTFEQKRFLLRNLIQTIYWNSDTGEVEIKLFGS